MTTVKVVSYAGTGYYTTAMGFINDANAAVPNGWTDNTGAGCTSTIVASAGTHNKVLDLNDASGANYCNIKTRLFGSLTYGTLEVYGRMTDVTKSLVIQLCKSDETVAFNVNISSSKFTINNGAVVEITGVGAPANDTWYHVKIHFETTAGSYQGLAQYTFRVYIDGTVQTNADFAFWNNVSNVNSVNFQTGPASSGYHGYIDAVGCTGYLGYAVGDNTNAYTTVPYRHAKARRGTHESHHDFSSFDITKMSFPQQI